MSIKHIRDAVQYGFDNGHITEEVMDSCFNMVNPATIGKALREFSFASRHKNGWPSGRDAEVAVRNTMIAMGITDPEQHAIALKAYLGN